MPSKGALSGRLDRIRTSKKSIIVPKKPKESIVLLKFPWKQVKSYVSMRQKIVSSPFSNPTSENSISLFPEMETRDIENLLFYDLETTGLSGGAGTLAFLAGFGWIKNDRLIINQYFLHDFPGEIDFLLLIKELLTDDKILVSYNGKSFDHPLLRTRFLMKGLKLPLMSEIDLLHTSRRLWKKRLPSCRLSTIEDSILDIHRVNDIPGIEIPDIYFNFLKTNNSEPLDGVFKHHLQDIESLAVLFSYMEERWNRSSIISEYDRTSFGKLMLSRGRAEGLDLLQESFLNKDTEAGKIVSIYYKRRKEFSAAAEIWKKMWKNENDVFQGIELAKYYEHKTKDIESALSIVILLLKTKIVVNNLKLVEALEHRCKRLERKELARF